MGLFKKRPKAAPQAASAPVGNTGSVPDGVAGTPATAPAADPVGPGPYDSHEVPEIGMRADLGALRVPVIPGMQVRMELDRATQQITGVTVMLPDDAGISAIQLQAFSAPKTMGIWDEIREEIAQGVTSSGGTVDDVPGVLGRELIAYVNRPGPGGNEVRKARFVGHDGPRWFLRGVITGPAATDAEAAKQLEGLFQNTVVVRGDDPKPPRDLLPLKLPVAAEKMPDDEAAKMNIDPFKRGPEIAEVR